MTDLKELRVQLGLTQAGLAEKIGVSENTIQNWESLKKIPKGENLKNYLDGLEITNPTEREKIAGEITGVLNADKPDEIDNIPYFLFTEDSSELTKIKKCVATADELDMLAYVDYCSEKALHAKKYKPAGMAFPLEFAFFEKYGGYNMTRKKIADARNRLSGLYPDALEFAEKNPGCEYRLSSFDKGVIVDKIGKLLGNMNFQKEIDDLYNYLKTIEAVGTDFNPNNLNIRLEKSQAISRLLQTNYDRTTGECNLAQLTGYVELVMDNPQVIPNLKMLKFTERGKQFIQWGNEQRGIQ